MTSIILRRRKLGRGSSAGISAASTTGIYTVRNWKNNDVPAGADINGYVFRWGCTSTLPVVYSQRTVVNTADAIHWCSDKRQGRLDMQAAGVPVPKTWGTFDEFQNDPTFTGSVVVRPERHAQGRNLFVHHGDDNLFQRCASLGSYYISELVNKVAEYRVMVVCNRVAWVAKKTPGNPEDVAWNVARGGRFDNVRWGEWPAKVIDAALKAARVGKLDFGGVDVMVDAVGNPYVLEVNSAPSQTSAYRQSCVAKCFDYIVTKGKEHFADVEYTPRRTWKSYIHPALRTDDA